MQKKLDKLRQQLLKNKVDGFIVPSGDEFMSEFTPAHARRLEWLTGFSGSYGVAVVLKDKAAFFSDGRYTLQAKKQVGTKDYKHFNIADKKPHQWLKENLKKGQVVGIDATLHTKAAIDQYNDITIKILPTNPIDKVWDERPAKYESPLEIFPLKYAGEAHISKRRKIAKELTSRNIDAFIITAPDSLCWLLNIRASDLPCTPFVLAYGIIYKDAKVEIFIDDNRVSAIVKKHLGRDVKITSPTKLEDSINKLINKNILLDSSLTPYWFYKKLFKAKIVNGDDPCQSPKACKNKSEIKGIEQAHIYDGVAVTNFLYWLEHNKSPLTELDIVDKILEFRKAQTDFICTSFDTIAGYNSNGAIVHYRADAKSNKKINGSGLLLVDSGGQYNCGTTDITRTISIGNPTLEHKQSFTAVLKGHIALAEAVFPAGTSGSQLDILARQYLWQDGKDYDHGTGHGVGCFLNVHEGPQRISKMPNKTALMPGMVISNEPGYYKENAYGIRIESLVVVEERAKIGAVNKKYYGFKTITLAPIDIRLVNFDMLTDKEFLWLQKYHKEVKKKLWPYLSAEIKKWFDWKYNF